MFSSQTHTMLSSFCHMTSKTDKKKPSQQILLKRRVLPNEAKSSLIFYPFVDFCHPDLCHVTSKTDQNNCKKQGKPAKNASHSYNEFYYRNTNS